MLKRLDKRLVIVGSVAAIAAGGAVGVGAQADPPTAESLSARLKAEPTLDFNDRSGLIVEETLVRARASELAAEVPLPPDGSYDDIQWHNIGAVSDAQIKSFLQANASCDWYRYALAHPPTGDTVAIIRDIPDWSGVRGRDIRRPAQLVADDVAHGKQQALERLATGACTGRPSGFPLPADLRGPHDP